jgi:ADP-ribose pyrophosphatase YjhB (NUDIX family)
MTKVSHFNESPIDHFIQADIVKKLFASNGVMTFSSLKPDDVENSLFMYHMRKLADRGVVARSDEGFSLTILGVRWVNFIGPSTLQPRMLPRVLINYVVVSPDKSKVLLSRRKGTSATKLNEYLLPGGLHEYGLDLSTAAKKVLESINIASAIPKYLGAIEVLNTLSDGLVYHSVSFIHEVLLDGQSPNESEHFSFEWVAVKDIDSPTYERPIKDIVDRYLRDAIQPIESITINEN